MLRFREEARDDEECADDDDDEDDDDDVNENENGLRDVPDEVALVLVLALVLVDEAVELDERSPPSGNGSCGVTLTD